ncbi:hypothetical protein VitviT2T_015727 [Vitis vinifera]|uniref:Uncharacterized protein n=2 Tax=Vitis vinifera TaxID=29760 RepID=A0ABY9CNH1_VITVI|nr:hypothetical protein VitviT2T_015727 [Vitis vinifera]
MEKLLSLFAHGRPLLFLYMLYKIGKRSKGNISAQKLPLEPWKLPLIGNMHQLIDGSLPHRSLSRLTKQYESLMSLQLGEVSTLIISSPEMAKQVMKTHDINFAQRPPLFVDMSCIIRYRYN